MQLNLKIHEQALNLRQIRSSILANNIANEETPNYKARDIDFQQALTNANHDYADLKQTHNNHYQHADYDTNLQLKYRIPNQPSIDNNTVELETENRLFTQNAINYQTSFTLLNNRLKLIGQALKSE